MASLIWLNSFLRGGEVVGGELLVERTVAGPSALLSRYIANSNCTLWLFDLRALSRSATSVLCFVCAVHVARARLLLSVVEMENRDESLDLGPGSEEKSLSFTCDDTDEATEDHDVDEAVAQLLRVASCTEGVDIGEPFFVL